MNSVCPCSGDSGGGTVLFWLAVAFVLLLLFRQRWNERGVQRRKAVKQEENESQSIFEGPTASQQPEPPETAKGPAVPWKAVIIIGLVVFVGLVMLMKRGSGKQTDAHAPNIPVSSSPTGEGLPRLIEIGSVTCIPCKMMAPILDELRKEYAGRLQVDFIDVQVEREEAMKFRIQLIPTQVFLDARGKELFRHEGFFPKEEILAKWKELGVDLEATPPKSDGE